MDYGADGQASTAVLRFRVPGRRDVMAGMSRFCRRNRLPRFEPGDLAGILPPDSNVARCYLLASASQEGILEICVRKRPGDLCSGFLRGLELGDTIDVFIRPSPSFRPAAGRTPVILIGAGAGAGIAPLAGFIRYYIKRRTMHLYWGGRSPESDFLYESELEAYLRDRRLTGLHAAFSRVSQRARQPGIALKTNATAIRAVGVRVIPVQSRAVAHVERDGHVFARLDRQARLAVDVGRHVQAVSVDRGVLGQPVFQPCAHALSTA